MAISYKQREAGSTDTPVKIYQLLSIKDVSRQSGLGLGTLRNLLREGKMPTPKYFSKQRVWDQLDISSWIEDNLSDTPLQTNIGNT